MSKACPIFDAHEKRPRTSRLCFNQSLGNDGVGCYQNKVHVVQSYHERWQLRPSSGLLCVTREDTPHILSKILTPRPETLRDHVDTHMVLLQNALPTHRCPGGRLSSHLVL